MSAKSYAPWYGLSLLLTLTPSAIAQKNNQEISENLPSPHATQVSPPLAPVELTFRDFYKTPVGHQGLEPTEKLRALENKRVRIVGFMAQEEEPTAGIFLLASRPAQVAEKADGMADDLPIGTVTVYMPAGDQQKILAYRPGPWVISGILQLGNREDNNGRVSYVRLMMDQNDITAASQAKTTAAAN